MAGASARAARGGIALGVDAYELHGGGLGGVGPRGQPRGGRGGNGHECARAGVPAVVIGQPAHGGGKGQVWPPKVAAGQPAAGRWVYPYLLRDLTITRANQAWAADITYLPMARGFLYLVAIMDWHSQYVVAWRLSNSLEADFCVDALKEALGQGQPEVFNTDQGSQFTSLEFTQVLQEHGVKISMDGKGRYNDNIFVERL